MQQNIPNSHCDKIVPWLSHIYFIFFSVSGWGMTEIGEDLIIYAKRQCAVELRLIAECLFTLTIQPFYGISRF